MLYIENMNIHAAPHKSEPDITMTNADFIQGYEQAINSRAVRASRFFTDADIAGIIGDYATEDHAHDDAELQYHAGQLTGLIAVRCLTTAYPLETNDLAPLQGKTHAPAAALHDMDIPAYGVVSFVSDWPDASFDAILTNSKAHDLDLEMAVTPSDAVDATPSALMHLKKHDIIALRDFLNQAVVTRWLNETS